MISTYRKHHRRLIAGALAIAATAAVVTPAVAGQSQTKTLRFFDKATDFRMTSADGTVKQPGPPVAGDIIDVSGTLYAGNHRRHARKASGTNHTRCVFTGPDTGTCQGEVAIGGSLILVKSDLGGNPFTAYWGTGRFKGITGTGSMTSIGEESNDSDVVLRYTKG
jgi:hypothetical protein